MGYVPYAVNPAQLGTYSQSAPLPAAGRGIPPSGLSAPLDLVLALLLFVQAVRYLWA
jgi:hypothetical protein